MPDALSRFARVSVVFETRSDGGLRVYSHDLPGFVLSHSNPDLVMADVVPALETIIGEMVGSPVKVTLQSERPAPSPVLERKSVDYVTRLAA